MDADCIDGRINNSNEETFCYRNTSTELEKNKPTINELINEINHLKEKLEKTERKINTHINDPNDFAHCF